MNKIKIGIPSTLLYYKYKTLWLNFFDYLGCEIIESPPTDKSILERGIKYSLDESCMAMKIYMGHVDYLIDKCDCILIPRLECIEKGEKLCTNFSALYDLVRNTFDIKILNYNVDVARHMTEEKAILEMGRNLGFNVKKILDAYYYAKDKEDIEFRKRIRYQKKCLEEKNKIKILLAGHPYNIRDKFLGGQVEEYLRKCGVRIIYSDIYDDANLKNDIKKISPKNYWTYNREVIASIAHYEKYVDGIVLITSFPCGPDSLSNEMILRNVRIPIINLVVDEATSDTGLQTRIESFIDILEERRCNK